MNHLECLMSLMSALTGTATRVDALTTQTEIGDILLDGERVEAAYKIVRDMLVFTDLRVITVNRQGLTGNKVEFMSVPYKNISAWSIENAGGFDMDAELKLHTRAGLLSWKFARGESLLPVQKGLASHLLR